MTQSVNGHQRKLPHPFFFNQPRSLSGRPAASSWEPAFTSRAVDDSVTNVQVGVFGGPTEMLPWSAKRDQVNTVRLHLRLPPCRPQVAITAPTRRLWSKNAMGFNVGVVRRTSCRRRSASAEPFQFSRATMTRLARLGRRFRHLRGGDAASSGPAAALLIKPHLNFLSALLTPLKRSVLSSRSHPA